MARRLAALLAAVILGCSCGGSRVPLDETPAPAVVAAQAMPPVVVQPHGDWSEAVLYFIVLDRFADGDRSNNFKVDPNQKGTFHGGDLAGLRQNLDELADLGVTAIWITPVVENIPGFVTGAGFPDWAYHGYWADDFQRVDRRFGSEAELKGLVEDCEKRGIRLLLDVVYNHAGYGSKYLTDPATRNWLRDEGRGTCGEDDITSCVSGLPDFKTELPEVADYLLTANIGLARRAGVHGFRLDTVKHVTHDFWKQHRAKTRTELGDDFFLIGEVWGGNKDSLDPWFEGDEMDAGFDFGFQGSALAFVQGRGRPVAFGRYLEQREEVREGYHLSHFLSSHDVPTAMYLLEGDRQRARLAAILQFTVSGIPVIYYGEEVGRYGGDWPDNRSDMPWGDRDILPGKGKPRDEELRADYKRLIEIRRSQPALWRGEQSGLLAEKDQLVFLRSDPVGGGSVAVALNRAETAANVEFESPAAWNGISIQDLWGGVPVESANGKIRLQLGPLEAAILVPRG